MTTKTHETKHISQLLDKKFEKSSEVEHQAMMKMVIDEGYAPKSYQPAWGKWIKDSEISQYDLDRVIRLARTLQNKYCPRGFVRKRLINKDWHKFNLPK